MRRALVVLAMALAYAHGAVQWLSADAATTTYDVTTNDVISGLPFQPKALRFWTMGHGSATDASSETTHLRRSGGFAVSTSSRACVGNQDQDAAATMVCTVGYRTDCVAMTLTSTPAFDGLLDLNAINSDGFQLIVDDAAPVNIMVFWEAWGGTDITVAEIVSIAEPAATGNVDYSVTGFVAGATDQVVMFFGTQSTAAAGTAARGDAGFCVGFAVGGNAADNIVVAGNQDDASTASDTDGYAIDGECLAMIAVAGGNPSARAQLTQFGTGNFRLNWIARATTDRRYIALAIKGGQWAAGSVVIDCNTIGATATASGLRFQPIGLSVISGMRTESTAGTFATNDTMSIGAGSSPSSRLSMGVNNENATASSTCEVNLGVEYDEIVDGVSSAGATGTLVDLNAVNPDGFQLICDGNTGSGSATTWVGYLAFASVIKGNPLTVLQAVHRAGSY